MSNSLYPHLSLPPVPSYLMTVTNLLDTGKNGSHQGSQGNQPASTKIEIISEVCLVLFILQKLLVYFSSLMNKIEK